ncbi:hypothetical protein ATKI12_7999 [Kitasatospora sp. Ki12]
MRLRGRIGGVLAGSALLPLLVCAVGRRASRSGGRMAVADALDRPVPLIAVTAVLLLAAALVRRRWDLVGRTAAGVGGIVLVGALGLLALHTAFVEPSTQTRTSSPARADQVLVVVHLGGPGAETEAQERRITVESGSGLSGRRWHLLDLPERFPGEGAFVSAGWTDAGHIRIATDTGFRVFGIDPDTGEPTLTESVGRVNAS